MVTIGPSAMKNVLRQIWQINRPLLIFSAPGVGKTSLVNWLRNELQTQLIDLRGNSIDSVDLRGLCDLSSDRTIWKRPDFLPEHGEGILFLDELGFSSPSVLQGFCGLINERRVAGHIIPAEWRIIAASNRLEDRAACNALPTPLLSRCIRMGLEANAADWLEWARPANVHPMVLAFISYQPDALMRFEPNDTTDAWPNPRTWEFVSDALHATTHGDINAPETKWIIEGLIGDTMKTAFYEFIKVYGTLPKFKDILAGTAKLPSQASAFFALATAFASILTKNPGHLDPIAAYIEKWSPEYRKAAINIVAATYPPILTHAKIIPLL